MTLQMDDAVSHRWIFPAATERRRRGWFVVLCGLLLSVLGGRLAPGQETGALLLTGALQPGYPGHLVARGLADETPAATASASDPNQPAQTIGQEDRLGRAPEDRSLQFLRQVTVLLEPGQWQFDIGIDYTLFETDFTDIVPPGVLAETRVRQRLLTMPMEFRYGLTSQAQAFVAVPLGWVNTEIARLGFDRFDNDGGIGDVQAGVTLLLRRSSGYGSDPDVTATFAFTAPTGAASVLEALLGNPTSTLGGGFWAASWNVLAIHSYDPVVLFYGAGSRHRFARTFEGVDVNPGIQFRYQMGLGFAVNESITLSTTFLGQYITEPELDGARLAGLILEPMRLRFAATIANGRHANLVEPFAEVGLTNDAPSMRIGVTWTF